MPKYNKYDLSNAFIETVDLPKYGEKRKYYVSKYEKGLELSVAWRKGVGNPSKADVLAAKTKYFKFIWRLRYTKADGRRSSIDIGFWPAMGQDAAIVAAREVKTGVVQGRDFLLEKKLAQEQVIPRDFVTNKINIAAMLTSFLKWRNERYPDKESTNQYYEKQINNHLLPRWGLFALDVINQWDWEEYIREVKLKFSDNVARHVHATMRVAYSFAVKSNDFPHVTVNPLLGLEVVKELKTTVRERYFSNAELHIWMNQLYERKQSATQLNILMLQLYQGLRISEILNIKISHLKELSQSEIKVIVKGGSQGHTMLSSQAIDLVKQQMRHLIESNIKSEWLFPTEDNPSFNYTAKDVGDIVTNVRRGWLQFSSHDLRRTCRTWLEEFGCSKEMRDRICNHAVPKGKDASYDHAKRKDEQLRWMQLWADKLDEVKLDENAFQMDADTSITEESASELDDLMSQLL